MIKDTKRMSIHAFFANGGIATTKECEMYFDQKKNKFICDKNEKKLEFSSLDDLSYYISFSQCIPSYFQLVGRYQWFVLTIDSVHAIFSRKKDAISYCMNISFDARTGKNINKACPGIYLYSGPKSTTSSCDFYIGLREQLMKNGFRDLIEKWEKENSRSRSKQNVEGEKC